MGVINLVLFGRTGNGKSSTGNSILGYNAFTTKRSSKSVTKKCQVGQRKWKDCRILKVIDTPGLFDTEAKKNFIETEIVRCIDYAKDGVHGFILVLSIQNRFTEEEANAFEKLQYLFGPKILDYMTIVFTCGDLLEEDCVSLDDYLRETSSNLKKLVSRCEKRVVIFDNKTKSEAKKESQISKLLQIVEANLAENGDSPYTNEVFEKAKSMASQYYYMQDSERGCQEKVKVLNEMVI
ncbi:immune-associated nucleotide-binding protein 8 [Cryptomeria japonica]|uniref:immune-associated nucleotide-binding protein 8 n=1 Tax=Cryptomeria japonica TaxID=3369 RepID=UPI0027DA1047|nr:immune-associated nucleotide-binding protein 8 [Cryptomeria japonica]